MSEQALSSSVSQSDDLQVFLIPSSGIPGLGSTILRLPEITHAQISISTILFFNQSKYHHIFTFL